MKLSSVSVLSTLPPTVLLLSGILNFLAFHVQQIFYARLILALLFYILASSQKRIRITYYLLFISSVVFFYLLLPSGKVLASLGPFRITQRALEEGLFRGITLSAYVFLSVWAISPSLRLPGKAGYLLSLSLRFFSMLFDSVGRELRGGNTGQYDKYSKREKEHDTVTNNTDNSFHHVSLSSKIDMYIGNILLVYTMQEMSKGSDEITPEEGKQHKNEVYGTQILDAHSLTVKKKKKYSVIGLVMICFVTGISWTFACFSIMAHGY